MDSERFTVSLKDDMCNLCKVNSIKRKNGGRYETGDIIRFSRGKNLSYGRIVNILWERQFAFVCVSDPSLCPHDL